MALRNQILVIQVTLRLHSSQCLASCLRVERLGVLLLPPAQNACPSHVTAQHFIRLPCKFPVPIYTPGQREGGTMRVKCLAKEYITLTRLGLEILVLYLIHTVFHQFLTKLVEQKVNEGLSTDQGNLALSTDLIA